MECLEESGIPLNRVGVITPQGHHDTVCAWLLTNWCKSGSATAVKLLPFSSKREGVPETREGLRAQYQAAESRGTTRGLAFVVGWGRGVMPTGDGGHRHIYQAALFVDNTPFFGNPTFSGIKASLLPFDMALVHKCLDSLLVNDLMITMIVAPSLQVYNKMSVVQDWPRPLMTFYDLMPVLRCPKLTAIVGTRLLVYANTLGVDAVVGVCSRGYLWAAAIVQHLRLPLVCVTKQGKMPSVVGVEYTKEDGAGILELQRGALDGVQSRGAVLVIDDVVATGGTMCACAQLVREVRPGVAVHGLAIFGTPISYNTPPSFDSFHVMF